MSSTIKTVRTYTPKSRSGSKRTARTVPTTISIRTTTSKKSRRKSYKKSSSKKKSGMKRTMKRNGGFLKLYTNPFTKGVTPKIPDGKALMSIGQKLMANKEFTIGESGTMTIALFPGYGGVIRVAGSTLSPTFDEQFPSVTPFRSYGQFTLNEALERWLAKDSIANWRIVSAGMRVTLINNAEENDGWWECIRIPMSSDTRDWMMVGVPGEAPNSYVICPTSFLGAQAFDPNSQFIDHPSYISGKLSRLYKQTFALKANDTNHPFVKVDDTFSSVGWTGDTKGPTSLPPVKQTDGSYAAAATADTRKIFANTADDASTQGFISMQIDRSYDIVLLRIHGRPSGVTNLGNGSSASRLLVTSVANVETVYAEGSVQSRMQTPSSGSTAPVTPQQLSFASNSAHRDFRPGS